jgi:hypothetical protein
VKENGSTEAIEELGKARYSGYDSFVDSHNVCYLKSSKLEFVRSVEEKDSLERLSITRTKILSCLDIG